MITAALTLVSMMAVHTPVLSQETPVEEEVLRTVNDPCQSKLELFVLGDEHLLSCPECTIWNLDDDPEDSEFWENLEKAKGKLNVLPSQYDFLRFFQLIDTAARRTMFPLFRSTEAGGVSIAEIAGERGLCEVDSAKSGDDIPDRFADQEAYRQWLISELKRLADLERAEWKAAKENGLE